MRNNIFGRFFTLLCIGTLLLAQGCDVVEDTGEEIILDRTVTFRFEVNPSEIEEGAQVVASATTNADLSGNLAGFSPGEIVSASVTEVELERVQPLQTDLNEIISSAGISLVASGLNNTLIAESDEMPDNVKTLLTVSPGRSVTAYLAKPVFSSELRFVSERNSDSPYAFLAKVHFQIVVTGL